jgi:hypothetical protein
VIERFGDGNPGSTWPEYRVYIDGVYFAAVSIISGDMSPPIDHLRIGAMQRFALKGLMDDLAIWDVALNVDEIQALAAGGPVPEPATIMLLGLGALTLIRRKR